MQPVDQRSPPGGLIAFVQPLGIGLVIAAAFVLTYLSALHKPTPHDLPVGVVAPASSMAEIQRAISARSPGTIALRSVADAGAARRQVENGQLVAAYLPEEDGLLLVAGAQGPAVTQAVTGILGDVTSSPLRVEDIVPLAAEDPRGLSSFYLLFGITLAGFIFGQTSHMYSKRLTLVQKLGQALLFAALAGLIGALIAGPMIGVLPGPFLTVTGILVLLALATALVTMGFTALIGDPGIALSTLLLVILGNAISGGAVPTSFLPDGFRPLSPLLPAGAGTHALAEVSYFDPGGALRPVGVLAIWTLAALLLVAVSYRRQSPPRTP